MAKNDSSSTPEQEAAGLVEPTPELPGTPSGPDPDLIDRQVVETPEGDVVPQPEAIDGLGRPVIRQGDPVSQVVPGEEPFKASTDTIASAALGATPVDIANRNDPDYEVASQGLTEEAPTEQSLRVLAALDTPVRVTL